MLPLDKKKKRKEKKKGREKVEKSGVSWWNKLTVWSLRRVFSSPIFEIVPGKGPAGLIETSLIYKTLRSAFPDRDYTDYGRVTAVPKMRYKADYGYYLVKARCDRSCVPATLPY